MPARPSIASASSTRPQVPSAGIAVGRAWTIGAVTTNDVGSFAAPTAIAGPATSWPIAIGGGLLVGFGARYGGGCTSGHGVCGVGRLSWRSIAGCATFVVVAMLVVFVVRHAGAAS